MPHGRATAPVRSYILSLSHSLRNPVLPDQLRSNGIAFETVIGRDGDSFSPDELDSLYSARAARYLGRPLAPREVACALGHQTLMDRFLKAGGDWALMLEDDADFHPDALPWVLIHLRTLDPSPTLVQLQHFGSCVTALETPDSGCKYRIERAYLPPTGAGAYLINKAGAAVARRAYRRRRIDSVADWPFHWRFRLKFFLAVPPAARQTPIGGSHIAASRRQTLTRSSTQAPYVSYELWGRYIRAVGLFAPLFGVSAVDQVRYTLAHARMRGSEFRRRLQ